MFKVELTGSRFYRSAHYVLEDRGCLVVQRSKARATRFTRERAKAIADKWSDPNGFTAHVVEA